MKRSRRSRSAEIFVPAESPPVQVLILTREQFQQALGVGRATWYQRIARHPQFPPPLRYFGTAKPRWSIEAVQCFARALAAEPLEAGRGSDAIVVEPSAQRVGKRREEVHSGQLSNVRLRPTQGY
jgi:predicted DNA-binding transcriptional regulator AlpA